MRIYIFVLILLACVASSAQQHFLFRIGGGVTSHYSTHTKAVGTFNIGLGYEYEFDQKWSVSPYLLFAAKGWKEKDVVVPARDNDGNLVYDETGKQVFGKKGVKSRANYLQMPILANYYIHLTSPHYLSLSFGPYVAYGIAGNTETYGDTDRHGSERLYYEENTFGKGSAHRFDAGVTIGAGYEYDRHINIGINADLGLLRVTPAGGKNKSFYLSFMYRL